MRERNGASWELSSRTFADLYSVPAASIDVVWDALRITAHCLEKTFVRQTGGSDGRFIGHDDDQVIVTLIDEKRTMLEAD
jgi:hypothetical protein